LLHFFSFWFSSHKELFSHLLARFLASKDPPHAVNSICVMYIVRNIKFYDLYTQFEFEERREERINFKVHWQDIKASERASHSSLEELSCAIFHMILMINIHFSYVSIYVLNGPMLYSITLIAYCYYYPCEFAQPRMKQFMNGMSLSLKCSYVHIRLKIIIFIVISPYAAVVCKCWWLRNGNLTLM
jgi:hypothetical protein